MWHIITTRWSKAVKVTFSPEYNTSMLLGNSPHVTLVVFTYYIGTDKYWYQKICVRVLMPRTWFVYTCTRFALHWLATDCLEAVVMIACHWQQVQIDGHYPQYIVISWWHDPASHVPDDSMIANFLFLAHLQFWLQLVADSMYFLFTCLFYLKPRYFARDK